MGKYLVYIHLIPNTEKIFYVGKGKEGREKRTNHRNRFWKNVVEKHGGFDVRIVKSGLSNKIACELEKELIAKYGRRVFDDGGVLVNLTTGGEGREGFGLCGPSNGRFGKKVPYHISKNFGRDMKGKNNPMKGKNHSEEAKKKISEKAKARYADGFKNPMLGRKRPKAAALGKKYSKKVGRFTKSNELMETYPSLNEAARLTGYRLGNISSACNGRLKTYKGFIWMFIDGNDVDG